MTEQELQTAIDQVEQTLRAVGILDFSGEVQLLDWSKSTAKDGPKVKLLLTDDDAVTPFEAATVKKGKMAGQLYHLFAIRIDEPARSPVPMGADQWTEEERQAIAARGPSGPLVLNRLDDKSRRANAMLDAVAKVNTKPFGKQASELYRIGFFFNSKIMEAVGTDQEFLDWLKTQPCCANPSLSSPSHHHIHDGDIVPAHVRRIAAGAGTAIKPLYSAVPLCDHHHKLQHQHGESVLGGKDWFDQQRAKHLSRWMAEKCFRMPSMGYVQPMSLQVWAKARGLEHFLPEVYR